MYLFDEQIYDAMFDIFLVDFDLHDLELLTYYDIHTCDESKCKVITLFCEIIYFVHDFVYIKNIYFLQI